MKQELTLISPRLFADDVRSREAAINFLRREGLPDLRMPLLFAFIRQVEDEDHRLYLRRLAAALLGPPQSLHQRVSNLEPTTHSRQSLLGRIAYAYGLTRQEEEALRADYDEYTYAICAEGNNSNYPSDWRDIIYDAASITNGDKIPDQFLPIVTERAT